METFHRTFTEGIKALTGEAVRVAVLPDVSATLFERVGIKINFGKAAQESVRWGVVELEGGIRLYVHQNSIIVTKQDLNP